MTQLLEPAQQVRPTPPTRSAQYFLPYVALIAATAVAGVLGSISGIVWGAAVGALTYGALRWARLTGSWFDLGLLAVAGGIGFAIFDAVLTGRDTVIAWRLSLTASLGWLLFGLGVGWVVVRHRRQTNRFAVAWTGLAFGFGAFLAMQIGTTVGYLEPLRARQVEQGAIQMLTTEFFVWAGAIAIAVGAGIAFSFIVGSPLIATLGLGGVLTLLSFYQISFSIPELITKLGDLGVLAGEFWPPDWTWPRTVGQPDELQIVEPFIETLQIAVIGATFGCIIAVPLAFLASRPTTTSNRTYWISKTFMNVVRTIPDLFWAVLFATAVGFGSPFAGALAMFMFSLTIMAKLLSETVDAIDPGPLEAGRASGAGHWSIVQYAAYPQVAPNYVAYALYIFELNIRASVVIGIVGAGGIGRLLDERRKLFQWDQVMAIVIVIFVTVVLIEIVSIWIRKRLV